MKHNYLNSVFTEDDILRHIKNYCEEIKEIQDELESFKIQAKERIKTVIEYERDKKYSILGHTSRDGRKKEIMLIVRYVDRSQRDERYSFNSIGDMRIKLAELKEKYSGVDWSNFYEEIK